MPRGQTVLATWHKSKAGLYPQGSGVPVEEAKLGVMELEGENSERHRTENAGGELVHRLTRRATGLGSGSGAGRNQLWCFFLDSSAAYHPPQCPKNTPSCHPPCPTRAFVKEQPPQNLCLSGSRTARHIQPLLLILDTESEH